MNEVLAEEYGCHILTIFFRHNPAREVYGQTAEQPSLNQVKLQMASKTVELNGNSNSEYTYIEETGGYSAQSLPGSHGATM